jgi:hypothetical protein
MACKQGGSVIDAPRKPESMTYIDTEAGGEHRFPTALPTR